jgi:hypothetical protein
VEVNGEGGVGLGESTGKFEGKEVKWSCERIRKVFRWREG